MTTETLHEEMMDLRKIIQTQQEEIEALKTKITAFTLGVKNPWKQELPMEGKPWDKAFSEDSDL